MKPLIFDYMREQTNVEFPELTYDRKSGLNFINGTKFVDLCNSKTVLQTKTFTQRESDDEEKPYTSSISKMFLVTKTDTIREVDDDMNFNNLTYLLTKTEENKEQDE
ncbi:hypothetical protein [Leptospira alstonii]|nr:hypothetical protein [Leptospira alstonii]